MYMGKYIFDESTLKQTVETMFELSSGRPFLSSFHRGACRY